MASRSCSLRRAAEVVSRAAAAMGALSQTLPERIGGCGSRERFAKAVQPRAQEKASHAFICLEKRDAQQRCCAERFARGHAETANWHRSGRASEPAHAGCGGSSPVVGFCFLVGIVLGLPPSFRICGMRSVFQWNVGTRTLELGKRTLIMGIVNVSPDSFSDGGLYLDSEKAMAHALQLLDEGADIVDVGGESTRPGAKTAVSAEEELRRVLPVISALKKQRPNATISIDTYKASVAFAAVANGAEIVNDVSGLRWDLQMAKTVAELKCGVVVMHMRGRPEEWRNLSPPSDVVLLVKRELREWVEAAVLAGVR